MTNRTVMRIMIFMMPVLIILGLIWNISVYNECKSDGYSSIACYSMMHKGGYIVVDAMDERP